MAKKVLVVDDELDIRVFMTTLLETNGYKPISAEDGQQGLEVAKRNKPSLVIMDVMMPKESGIFLYRGLKKDPDLQKIPVIVVSALAKKTFYHSNKLLDEYEGQVLPEPTDYIEKPPEAEELLAAIKKILG